MEEVNVNREYLLKYDDVTQQFKNLPELISEVVALIPRFNCICLYGDLGAGKTYFTGRLLEELGVTEPVTSPTFVIMNEYELLRKGFEGTVAHIDVYRLSEEEFNAAIPLDELLGTRKLVLIEWADKIKNLLPKQRLDIEIKGFASE